MIVCVQVHSVEQVAAESHASVNHCLLGSCELPVVTLLLRRGTLRKRQAGTTVSNAQQSCERNQGKPKSQSWGFIFLPKGSWCFSFAQTV